MSWALCAQLPLLMGTAPGAEPAPVELSASLATDRPEALLFPGDSVSISLEAAVHPGEAVNWDALQVRLASEGTAPEAGAPVKVTGRLPRSRALPLSLDKWYPAKDLGITAASRSVKLEIEHQGFTRDALVLRGEVQSTQAVSPAATARFPVHCAAFELLDIADPADPRDDRTVVDGSTVFLTHLESGGLPLPLMPRLVARIHGLPKDCTVHWRFASRYPKRGGRDDFAYPKDGSLDLPANEPWKIFSSYFGQFFGGSASVEFEVTAPGGKPIFRGSRTFRILSENPRDRTVREYIQARSGEFWYAWAIAQHESRQWKEVFNQFNQRGRLRQEPNFGPPDGWGVFQIDSARGETVSTKEVWDLRENVFAALDELKTAKRDTHNYLAAIRRTYPKACDGPPPSYRPPGCRTTLTWEEASIMQLFNGAAVIVRLKNSHGTYSFYRSCWRFLPHNPAGKRWVFVRNRNNYVYKVVKHEIEGGMESLE